MSHSEEAVVVLTGIIAWYLCGFVAVRLEDDGTATQTPYASAFLDTMVMVGGVYSLARAIRRRMRKR